MERLLGGTFDYGAGLMEAAAAGRQLERIKARVSKPSKVPCPRGLTRGQRESGRERESVGHRVDLLRWRGGYTSVGGPVGE